MIEGAQFAAGAGRLMSTQSIQHLGCTFASWNAKITVVGQNSLH